MLAINTVETFYGKIQALKGVSLKAESGKIVCILGANGAGKTTLVNNISGIVECQKGTIEFDGQRIENIPPERVVQLGISQVPQGRLIFPYLTVIENLKIGAFTPGSLWARPISTWRIFPWGRGLRNTFP